MDLSSVYENACDMLNSFLSGLKEDNNALVAFVCSSTVAGLIWLVFVRRHGTLKGKWQKKSKTTSTNNDHLDYDYRLKNISVPVLSGWALKAFVRISASTFGQSLIVPLLRRGSGLDIFKGQYLPDLPTLLPIIETDDQLAINSEEEIDLWSFLRPGESTSEGFDFMTLSKLVELYRKRVVTPLEVAKTVVEAVKVMEESNRPMKMILQYHEKEILEMAAESTARYEAGTPLSVYDGVPVSAKDNYRVFGYKTHTGTPFVDCHTTREEDESTLVNKLRKGGAVIIGIGNMHQLGMGVTGYNPSSKHGTSRNPYNSDYSLGGSSGGSAGSIAAGICMVSLGVDGGGSIRIPAAACGVVGIKATYGRMSGANMIDMADSVSHTGPIAPTVRDLAIAYAFLAGPDRNYLPGLGQPKVSLEGFENVDLTGIKLGIDWVYFKDSSLDIVRECQRAVEYLRTECNAEIVDIQIPELEEARIAHLISIMNEMMTYGYEFYHNHFDELGYDIRASMLAGNQISGVDFFMAQKQRTRIINILKSLFRKVDCILFPAFAVLPPKLDPAFFSTGLFNGDITSCMMRYVFLGNLSGIPSVVLPVGYNENNLPISLQISGAWWQEHVVLRVAHAAEGALTERKKPEVHFTIV